jgi:hypothetical protein
VISEPPAVIEYSPKSPFWTQGEIIKQRLIDELHKKLKVTIVSLYYQDGKRTLPFSSYVISSAVGKLCELGFGVKIIGSAGDPNYSLQITRL